MKFVITGGVDQSIAPHGQHPLARLTQFERSKALGELIVRLASDDELISDQTRENSCQPSPSESEPIAG